MNSVDKTFTLGRLTDDPKLVKEGESPFVTFSLAVNRKWKGDDGQLKETAVFLDFEVNGKRALALHQYAKKGQRLHVEGYHRMNEWEDGDGNRHRRLVIRVVDFTFIELVDLTDTAEA